MLPPLREVIERHGLFTRKALGQHFLLDGNITAKIAREAAPLAGVNVLEIGSGPGGLTRALLASDAQHVYAVEKDERCLAILSELGDVYPGRLTVHMEDALRFKPCESVPAPRAIVANLPYNVGTLLLIGWLKDIAVHGADSYRSLTLMFQTEVAERLYAAPDTDAYGRLSVMVQFLCDVEPCFDLSPAAFTPPPKVSSTVVRLTPLAAPRFPASFDRLEKTVAAAFGQRRKMLRAALKTISPDPILWLERADIDPTRRAETLSVEEFCRLANDAG